MAHETYANCPCCGAWLQAPAGGATAIRCPACKSTFRTDEKASRNGQDEPGREKLPPELTVFMVAGAAGLILVAIHIWLATAMLSRSKARTSPTPVLVAGNGGPGNAESTRPVLLPAEPFPSPTPPENISTTEKPPAPVNPAGPDEPREPSETPSSEIQKAVVLLAKDAKCHGKKVKFQIIQDKGNIGYWVDDSDWVSWDFDVVKAGRFEVEIEYSVPHTGGVCKVVVDDENILSKVKPTGGWDRFVVCSLGTITIAEAGPKKLEVRVEKKQPRQGLMNLSYVALRPVIDATTGP